MSDRNPVHTNFRLNGKEVSCSAPARRTLLESLRSHYGLTGAKPSCEVEVCGTCTALVDGEPVSACTYLLASAHGRSVLTIEGLASDDGQLHPIQEAFLSLDAFQCGYCTPGFILTAHALLHVNPEPTRDEVIHAIDGNICRCTGYEPIIDAILLAAGLLREATLS